MPRPIQILFFGSMLCSLLSTRALATTPTATCLNNGCHKPLTVTRYLHGPVAAELAGARACIVCHQPTGAPCLPNRAGEFAMPTHDICLPCHGQKTATKHSASGKDCLKCHDPHGSETSRYLERDNK